MANERTRPTRAQTREKVLAAALQVFGERGIAAASVSEVAAAAGMTKGAVYSSFASKDELVLAMMEEHAMQRLTAALASIAQDPRAAAAGVGAVLIGAIRSDAVWHRLLAEYFALSYHDEDTRLALRQRRREARGAVARALRQLSESTGAQLPMEPERLAVILFAVSNGLGIEAGIDPEAVPDDLLGELLGLIGHDFFAELR
ncbi:MAG TPA: TetR/AcrR family transcriptional regulator [Solirubrobacteraceae bacterium]|nr:TetR/AcrR family transcriptional regulator [Solirubrobacteraceae bacterium]